MTKKEIYLKHKKQNIINLVNSFNERTGGDQFEIDKRNLNIEKTFCNPDFCSKCEGACCTTNPCIFSPNDFLDITDYNYMVNIFETGLVCINRIYIKDKGEVLVIMPCGIANKKIANYHPVQYSNSCSFLGKNGCLLPAEYRPSAGLLYYPTQSCIGRYRCCRALYSEQDTYDEYEKYQDILWQSFSHYQDKLISSKRKFQDSYGHAAEEDVLNLTRKLEGYRK